MLPEIINRIITINLYQKSNNNYKYITNTINYENNLNTLCNKLSNRTQIPLGIMVNPYFHIQNKPELIEYLVPRLDSLFSNREAGKIYVKFSGPPNMIPFNIWFQPEYFAFGFPILFLYRKKGLFETRENKIDFPIWFK